MQEITRIRAQKLRNWSKKLGLIDVYRHKRSDYLNTGENWIEHLKEDIDICEFDPMDELIEVEKCWIDNMWKEV